MQNKQNDSGSKSARRSEMEQIDWTPALPPEPNTTLSSGSGLWTMLGSRSEKSANACSSQGARAQSTNALNASLLGPATSQEQLCAAVRLTTLSADSETRKQYPLYSGCLNYFPAALAGVSRHSKLGNDKHNPGQTLHHARSKSGDHADCIVRHLIDLADYLTAPAMNREELLTEANALAWRALALSQELHERYGGAPWAPAAR